MTNLKSFDSVTTKDNVAILSNAITDCMIENQMTLQVLDQASKVVEDVYRKNATMKKAD